MHKKFLLCVLLLGLCGWLGAEVGVISVTDEAKHRTKEDFLHTFEYYVINPAYKDYGKCQATRISKRWFVTAAHCLERCQTACTIRVDLLEQSTSAFLSAEHSAKKPIVFVHPGYAKEKFVKNDFALIKLDVNKAPATYYRRPTKETPANVIIPKQLFQEFLAQNLAARRALYRIYHPSFPPLMFFDAGNYKLDRTLSVISIFDGKREVKLDPHPVYYVKQLGYAYTTDFGIRKGMSGSGVMTNTGELIGVIDGTMFQLSAQSGKEIKGEFLFTVFNQEITDFMKEVMGSDYDLLDWKDAYPYAALGTSKNFTGLINRIKRINTQLSQASNKK